jgi:hypothetical protein
MLENDMCRLLTYSWGIIMDAHPFPRTYLMDCSNRFSMMGARCLEESGCYTIIFDPYRTSRSPLFDHLYTMVDFRAFS